MSFMLLAGLTGAITPDKSEPTSSFPESFSPSNRIDFVFVFEMYEPSSMMQLLILSKAFAFGGWKMVTLLE